MTKFPLTAVLILSLAGCSRSCEWHAGSGTSSSSASSSGSEQPVPTSEPRRGSRHVTRVTVNGRPAAEQPAPATTPEVVQPVVPAESLPAAQPVATQPSGSDQPAAAAPAAETPATTGNSGGGAGSWGGVRRPPHRPDAAQTPAVTTTTPTEATPAPATTETPSATTPAPSSEEVLRRRTDKQTAEERAAAQSRSKKLHRLGGRGKDGAESQAPAEKTDRRR